MRRTPINRTPMIVRFLVFAKIVSLQSNTVRGSIKSEKRTSGIFSPSSFALVLVDRGRNFHFSKSQKKFRPADRNGKLAKPNMYFAAALITFAAKTPTANDRRPTKKRERLVRSLLFPSLYNFSFLFFLFSKTQIHEFVYMYGYICVLRLSRKAMRPECEEDSSVFLTVRIN